MAEAAALSALRRSRNFLMETALRKAPKKPVVPIKRWRVTRGDTVEIIADPKVSADAGKQGKVLRVDRKKNRVYVEGVAMVSTARGAVWHCSHVSSQSAGRASEAKRAASLAGRPSRRGGWTPTNCQAWRELQGRSPSRVSLNSVGCACLLAFCALVPQRKKAIRPEPGKEGGMVPVEGAIHYSNVALVDPTTG